MHSLAHLSNFLCGDNCSTAGSVQLIIVMLLDNFHMREVFGSLTRQLHHNNCTKRKVRSNQQAGVVLACQLINLF